ncbi:conjugal transfer protein TrbJ [Brevundimonas viscosa]|uniref:P-type conjugative transfer protein TrbJ n=1 Tax=Brevundimonas viscosa TaxID=871741 RepID=A0A1I6TNE0_9CAUL|nr:conjugal transfer protein TrbJ [Brevundimonas viscosa]SFS90700.1 P-type conjugative transfer protein TrbJ [Brevundimonas viscosa]
MSTRSSTPSIRPDPRRLLGLACGFALLLAAGAAPAQVIVFDPRNQLQNALQAARQLESLHNEARQLINEARMLAASPYSHLVETSETLAEVAELAREVRGVAAEMEALERQFRDLYPEDLSALAPEQLIAQGRERNQQARRTAEDLARAAAKLEALTAGRNQRLAGALAASQAAQGQTAAVQSSTQVLAVLAEDLATLRAAMLAQSRLMAETAARQAADRAAALEARRRYWGRDAATPPPPAFSPFRHAGD